MIDILQLILIIPKAIESVIFFITAKEFLKKYNNLPFKERPQLNQIFSVGILSWFIYISLDLIIYFIAPLSLGYGYFKLL